MDVGTNMSYETDLANYRAQLDAYNNRQANIAAQNAAAIAAGASIDSARINDEAELYSLELQRKKFGDKAGVIAAADPRRDPMMRDNSAYYASNPITRKSMGLGGDYYSPEQRRIMRNQAAAGISKDAAKDRKAIKNSFASKGMSARSPFIDQLIGKSYLGQAQNTARSASQLDASAARENADWAMRGQKVVEDQNAALGSSEQARQNAISGYMALLSSLV